MVPKELISSGLYRIPSIYFEYSDDKGKLPYFEPTHLHNLSIPEVFFEVKFQSGEELEENFR